MCRGLIWDMIRKMSYHNLFMNRVKRICYLSPMRAAKVQASLRIRAVSPEPPLLAHTSSESRGTFRQKARSLALLNGWACAVKICHDGMLEDTNSLDGALIIQFLLLICPFSPADILNSSFSNNESAAVVAIDIDKKKQLSFTEQHNKCLQTDLRKIWKNNSGERTIWTRICFLHETNCLPPTGVMLLCTVCFVQYTSKGYRLRK